MLGVRELSKVRIKSLPVRIVAFQNNRWLFLNVPNVKILDEKIHQRHLVAHWLAETRLLHLLFLHVTRQKIIALDPLLCKCLLLKSLVGEDSTMPNVRPGEEE